MTVTGDIGHGHSIQPFGWSPDRSIPANAERFAGIADIEKVGIVINHPVPDGKDCQGVAVIHFDTPEVRTVFPASHCWQVLSWEPLTVSPSILCMACGDHGWIKEGRWVPA